MQSVALFDSVVVPHEDEWIVLPQSHSSPSRDDAELDDDEDDASYDYCEDAFSEDAIMMMSMEANTKNMTERARVYNFMDGISLHESEEFVEDDDGCLAQEVDTLLQDILETVEARQDHPGLGQSTGDRDMDMTPTLIETDLEEQQEGPNGSGDSSGSNQASASSYGDEFSTASSSTGGGRYYSSAGDDKRSTSDTSSSKAAGDFEQQPSRSRLCNKKRRKQKKMGKKVTAAAAAAAALSHIHLSPPKNNKQLMVAHKNKQVGNALQSIESYKDVLSKNIKNSSR